MVNEPTCAKHYTAPVFPENVVAGPNNSLSNVVVYISAGGAEGTGRAGATRHAETTGIRYIPHVLAIGNHQEI